MIRLAAIGLAIGLLAAGAPVARAQEALQPYQFVRSLQLIQDRIAAGDQAAMPMQAKLLELVDARLRDAGVDDFKDARNFRALLVYGMSGGNPVTVQAAISRLKLDGQDLAIAKGVINYLNGRPTGAIAALDPVDPMQLPADLGAFVALVKGSLLATDEPAYSMGLDVNSEPATDWVRYSYTSMTTPATVYALNVKTGERRLLKRQPVPGYDPAQYVSERLWATARDGAKIPVSIVYRKGFEKTGKAALLQYGYGSYGMSMDPGFSVTTVSLLDRGMAYAIAHIRGGQELGRKWYEDGKLLNKQNTFTDFIDVTDFLVKEGYAAPDRVAAYGGSAGGLLMGAIANMAPQKYRVILSLVPFVDVVTTMLDPSIPLTTNEYDEWGNPEQPEYYQYMLSYSPYDNLRGQAYPAMFVGTGLWDSQVQYWEPAKYVARLRDLNTSAEPVVLRTNMDAGHGGKSGRFRRYREQAEMYAFILEQLDVAAAG